MQTLFFSLKKKMGNHDAGRVANRACPKNIDLTNVLCLLLGGTATTYYGEEIGMVNLKMEDLSFEDCQDDFGKKFGVRFKNFFIGFPARN
jgi:glycosidase